jgi:hypothetical protein
VREADGVVQVYAVALDLSTQVPAQKTLNWLDLGLEARFRYHPLCNPLSYLLSGAGGAPSWKDQDEARRKEGTPCA